MYAIRSYYDEFVFSIPGVFETAVTTRSKVKIIDPFHLELNNEGTFAKLEIIASAPVEIFQTTIEEDAKPYTRIGIRFKEKQSAGTVSLTYSPKIDDCKNQIHKLIK